MVKSSEHQSRALQPRIRGRTLASMTRVRTRIATWWEEWRLPPDERRAARSERAVLEQLRRERDYDDPRARQLAAIEAERRRWCGGPVG